MTAELEKIYIFGKIASLQNCIWRMQGAGHLVVIESSVYKSIIEANVRPSVQQLKLGQKNWVMQQDNYLKHNSISILEWLKKLKKQGFGMA